MPDGLIVYIFFTYGYHAQGIIDHLFFKKKQSDFRELLLHHISANCLYAGFMIGNLWAPGAIMAWYHDASDIFVSLSRGLNCLGFKKLTVIAYAFLMLTWVHTRLIVHPFFMYTIFNNWVHPNPDLQPIVYLQLSFLGIMQILYIFWFFQLCKIAFKTASTGEMKDDLNRPEDLQSKKKN